jgi:hypothetical protein
MIALFFFSLSGVAPSPACGRRVGERDRGLNYLRPSTTRFGPALPYQLLISEANRLRGAAFSNNEIIENTMWTNRMVGVRGFEPPTPASRTQYSTRLSYTPKTATPCFFAGRFVPKHVGSNCTQEGISEQSKIFAKRFVKCLTAKIRPRLDPTVNDCAPLQMYLAATAILYIPNQTVLKFVPMRSQIQPALVPGHIPGRRSAG